eukprot:gene19049-biopygen29176
MRAAVFLPPRRAVPLAAAALFAAAFAAALFAVRLGCLPYTSPAGCLGSARNTAGIGKVLEEPWPPCSSTSVGESAFQPGLSDSVDGIATGRSRKYLQDPTDGCGRGGGGGGGGGGSFCCRGGGARASAAADAPRSSGGAERAKGAAARPTNLPLINPNTGQILQPAAAAASPHGGGGAAAAWDVPAHGKGTGAATCAHVAAATPRGIGRSFGGFYRLVADREVNGMPMWKSGENCLYSTAAGNWKVTDKEKEIAGNFGGIESIAAHGGIMPDAVAGWESYDGGKWHADTGVAVTSDRDSGAAAAGDAPSYGRGGG